MQNVSDSAMPAKAPQRHAARLLLVLAVAVVLTACGGGDPAPSGKSAAIVSESAAIGSASLSSLSYTMTRVRPPVAGSGVYDVRLDTRGMVTGTYVANRTTTNPVNRPFIYNAVNDSSLDIGPADPGISTLAFAIADSGLVVGAAYFPHNGGLLPGAFVWSPPDGFLAIDPEQNEGSFAYWVSDAGIVGGETVDATSQECTGAFRWDVASRTFTRFANFCPHTMNASGAMAGRYSPPGVSPYLAMLENDGSLRALLPGRAIDGRVRFLMENGDAVIDASCGIDAGQIVASGSTALVIKPGFVHPPPEATESFEQATIYNVSRSNLAVGLDQVFWSRPGMAGMLASGFVWSTDAGALQVGVGADSAFPRALNSAGVVVGFTPFLGVPQRAFVWTRESGGVLLETRVTNLPAETHIRDALDIGEGGHILATTGDDGFVILTPQQ